MKLATALRAAAWVGVAVVGWSLNIRWGADLRLGNGPPVTFHKHVVGALLLAFVAAVAMSASHRLAVRTAAAAAAAGVVAIAAAVRMRAPDSVVSGPGWAWLAAGAALVAVAAVAGLFARPPASARRRARR
ncbi:MAG: hypothetical protein D6689_15605 [Deltaproteobacteria bacterium]|nr:MAG: hypothetical protein D6689_15605 [Deltaproteobacteria bacterium]